jgi:hypothetical protein
MSDTNTGKHPSRIPEFASLEEEAAFWDTHDTTDFEDEFHPVTVVFAERLADDERLKRVEIRLDAETDRELTALARQQGLRKSSLVRSVVQTYLRDRHRNSRGSLNARAEPTPPR